MDNNSKFYADIQRILKYDRANNNGNFNPERACKEIAKRFSTSYKTFGALPEGISQYWLENKVLSSSDISKEPTEDTINWILDADDFLSAEKDKTYCFSKKDWEEIRELVNAEACDLDINLLSDLMSIIVENGAL